MYRIIYVILLLALGSSYPVTATANSALTMAENHLQKLCADGNERIVAQVHTESGLAIHDLSTNPERTTVMWNEKLFAQLCEKHDQLVVYHCHTDTTHPLLPFPSAGIEGPSDMSVAVTQLFTCASSAASKGRPAPDVSNFLVVTTDHTERGNLVRYGVEENLYQKVKQLGAEHGSRPLNAAKELFSGNPNARSLVDFDKGNKAILEELETIRIGVNRAYWDDLESFILEHCDENVLRSLETCLAVTLKNFVNWLPGGEAYFIQPHGQDHTPYLGSIRTQTPKTTFVSQVSDSEDVPLVNKYTHEKFVSAQSAILITCGVSPFDEQDACIRGVRFAKEVARSCRTTPNIGIIDGANDTGLVESQRAAGELRTPAILLYQNGRMLRTKNHSNMQPSFVSLVLCGMDNMFGGLPSY